MSFLHDIGEPDPDGPTPRRLFVNGDTTIDYDRWDNNQTVTVNLNTHLQTDYEPGMIGRPGDTDIPLVPNEDRHRLAGCISDAMNRGDTTLNPSIVQPFRWRFDPSSSQRPVFMS
ncbi:hypothetical protein I317_04491 [Kwoniella heveanensis CBS 569]|nr:hypothetical protein I317_04491 [Kwoniella heveanensis CBS 569]